MTDTQTQIVEKNLETVLIAGLRMQAPYHDCGAGFSKLMRKFGRWSSGKPFLLCYDREYQEIANYEVCTPIRKSPGSVDDEFDVRELQGGRCICLTHIGPYEELSGTYNRLKAHLAEQGLEAAMPSREVYIKGPGMIFRGNPKKYITEVQMLVA
ncbi:MAG: GyrI-like domain-containing protein [Planctomycetota bacterium]